MTRSDEPGDPPPASDGWSTWPDDAGCGPPVEEPDPVAAPAAHPEPASVPDPAAVQAALDTLARWIRAGRTIICPGEPGGDPPASADRGDPSGPGSPDVAGTAPDPEPAAPAPETAADLDLVPRAEPAAVRIWAREHGFRVAERGRLPVAVVHAYVASHRAG
ncbi:Lsr2 family DNA-binding protein [Cellulomonas pakistanensis]|uniref:Lsr2 DNA-binding domain-containing protein n=1 Tax=Cellulomonas pakistanensis TaxID=992287 RepID=A0A919PC54_9CELL|nr:histone-like nucleoid-structuring protein Lsr2 [Cellulomonas pakistanensis]GIG36860.1 hypothetical protein Cpa01nite_22410 [Cellulomonas pakistanensis]